MTRVITSLDTRLKRPPGADPVDGLMRAPQRGLPLRLQAGAEVAVVLRHDLETNDRPSIDVPDASFQLNVDPPHPPEEEGRERAVALAASADLAVVVGTTKKGESEGFDRLGLPGRQDEFVRRVTAANPRVAVVGNPGAHTPLG